MWESTYEQASKYNAQLKQPSIMKVERSVVFELQKQGYQKIEKWYRKRVAKVRIIRKIRAMISKGIKKFYREIFLNKAL